MDQCLICGRKLVFGSNIGGLDAKEFFCKDCGHFAMTATFYEDYILSKYSVAVRGRLITYLHRKRKDTTIPYFCVERAQPPARYHCVTAEELALLSSRNYKETMKLSLRDKFEKQQLV